MDIFTLHIHMYNIVNGIVGIKFDIFICERRVPIPMTFGSIAKYAILCGGGELMRWRRDLKEMGFMAVLLGGGL